MATKTAFETSDTVQLKGNVTGVTRLSRKAKALMGMGFGMLLVFILFSIYTMDDDDNQPKPAAGGATDAPKDAGPAKFAPASPGDLTKGVSDGQANPEARLNAPFDATAPGAMGPGMVVATAASGSAAAPSGAAGIIVPAPAGATGQGVGAPDARVASGGPLGKGGGAFGARGAHGDIIVPAPTSATTAAAGAAAPADGPATREARAAAAAQDQRAQLERRAREAGMEFGDGGGGSGGAPALGALSALIPGGGSGQGEGGNPLAALTAAAQSAQAASSRQLPLPIPVGVGQSNDANQQEHKEQFLKAQALPATYLQSRVTAPVSKFEMKSGWMIPIGLETGINTDLPGRITARVSENVYDSATGQCLLIPQGTVAIGVYDSHVAVGQTRALMAWQRLIFPDTSSLTLDGMPGADQAGYAGIGGDVDNHYVKIFGSAVMMSLISAGTQLSQPQTSSTGNAPSTGQVVAGAVGQQLAQVTTALIQRGLQVQPTLTDEPGTRIKIQVMSDIVFSGCYKHRRSV